MVGPNIENPIPLLGGDNRTEDGFKLKTAYSRIDDREDDLNKTNPDHITEKDTSSPTETIEEEKDFYETIKDTNSVFLKNKLLGRYPNLYGPLFERSYKVLEEKLQSNIEGGHINPGDISIEVSFAAEGPLLENNKGDNYKDFTFNVRCEKPVSSFEEFADEIKREIAKKIDPETNNDGSLLRNIPKYHMTDAEFVIHEKI